MSDGPFMSPVPLPCWNTVLERAGNSAYSLDQLHECIPSAIATECRSIPPAFLERAKSLLGSENRNTLFDAGESGAVDALRDAAAGDPLALTIADWIEDALSCGRNGSEAVLAALLLALRDGWRQRSRMLEEHAQREAVDRAVAQFARDRLRQAAPSDAELERIARAILESDAREAPRTAPKHKGLEEGPSLSPVEGARADDEEGGK
jgi:hypothetical protein